MTSGRPDHFAVGRLRKAHGLKGECTVFPLTDEADRLFATGETVWVLNLEGQAVAGPLTIARSRPYHREWLLTFEGHDRREAIEPWHGHFLGVPPDRLRPPDDDEVWLHELEGFAVRAPDGAPMGLVSAVYDLPSGLVIEVQGPKREVLVPYRKEFVTGVDRKARCLTVALSDEWPS